MNFDKIKGLVGDLAPTLGAALGGPVGGAAATMLADVLGCDPTPQKIGKALSQATPEQLAEIKKVYLLLSGLISIASGLYRSLYIAETFNLFLSRAFNISA